MAIFDCLWFDISSFYWLFGKDYTVYRPGEVQSLYYIDNTNFYFAFNQGQAVEKSSYTVKALNIVMGQIGGYTAILWLLINTIFDNYESFKFTNSLIGRVYACTPEGPNAPASQTEAESKQTIFETLTNHTDSWYSYRELLLTQLMRRFCCCLWPNSCFKKRIMRLEIYQAAQK
mmetsp:Transcript_32730/g.43178  ORF Transcript_32730/g.43178 Transcript_32730/m.43178 type:complete len:174 (+) Transcript_32730:28-549(+)